MVIWVIIADSIIRRKAHREETIVKRQLKDEETKFLKDHTSGAMSSHLNTEKKITQIVFLLFYFQILCFFFFNWQSYIEKGSYRWPLNLNEAYTWGPFKDSRHWGLLVEMFFMQVLLRMKLGILCSFSHMNQIKNVHQQNYKSMRNHNPQNLLHGYYSTVIKQQSYFIFSAYNSIPSFLSKVTIFLRPYSCPLRGIFHFDRNFTSFFI